MKLSLSTTIAHACVLAAFLGACTSVPVPPAAEVAHAAPQACHGKDPAALAAATQGTPPYTGKDRYRNVALAEGTVLYSLAPGAPPGFAVTERTLREAGGSWRSYHALVQVTTDPGVDAEGKPRRVRDMVREFHVMEPLCVAHGIARANRQFGSGGGVQYYVSPADMHKLRPGKHIPIAQWGAPRNDDERAGLAGQQQRQ